MPQQPAALSGAITVFLPSWSPQQSNTSFCNVPEPARAASLVVGLEPASRRPIQTARGRSEKLGIHAVQAPPAVDRPAGAGQRRRSGGAARQHAAGSLSKKAVYLAVVLPAAWRAWKQETGTVAAGVGAATSIRAATEAATRAAIRAAAAEEAATRAAAAEEVAIREAATMMGAVVAATTRTSRRAAVAGGAATGAAEVRAGQKHPVTSALAAACRVPACVPLCGTNVQPGSPVCQHRGCVQGAAAVAVAGMTASGRRRRCSRSRRQTILSLWPSSRGTPRRCGAGRSQSRRPERPGSGRSQAGCMQGEMC